MLNFKKTIVPVILIFSLLSSGCALFLVGAGAAGGYAVSKDEIEGFTEAKKDRVWASLKNVVKEDGAITLEDKERGYLEAIVGKSTVKVRLDQVTPTSSRLRVKARKTKGLFPDIKTAQDLYTKVTKKIS